MENSTKNDQELIIVSGYVTQDPQLHTNDNGNFITFSFKEYSENENDKPVYHNVLAPTQFAESAMHLKKGSEVRIKGIPKTNPREKDGKTYEIPYVQLTSEVLRINEYLTIKGNLAADPEKVSYNTKDGQKHRYNLSIYDEKNNRHDVQVSLKFEDSVKDLKKGQFIEVSGISNSYTNSKGKQIDYIQASQALKLIQFKKQESEKKEEASKETKSAKGKKETKAKGKASSSKKDKSAGVSM